MNQLILALALLTSLTFACASASLQTPPTVAPVTETSALTPAPSPDYGRGEEDAYISFIINVHDWNHPTESADILLQLIDLFEKYNVRGDFYFTAEITRELAETRPDVIERFRDSDMTISYHVRPPHPLYTGFDVRLKNLSDAELYQTLLDYETYALDMETGDLDRSRPGGYTYVAQVFGRNPVVAPAPNGDAHIKDAAQTSLRRARRADDPALSRVRHEGGTSRLKPSTACSCVRPISA